ncbi:hypothetical protein L9F63_002103, partial [Diploptera punctata]
CERINQSCKKYGTTGREIRSGGGVRFYLNIYQTVHVLVLLIERILMGKFPVKGEDRMLKIRYNKRIYQHYLEKVTSYKSNIAMCSGKNLIN